MKLIRNSATAATSIALLSGALLLGAVPASAAIVPSWSWSQGITFTSATFSNGVTIPPGPSAPGGEVLHLAVCLRPA